METTDFAAQLFSTSVNSPIKPQQSISKETTGVGVIGRKASLSNYGSATGTSRPSARRRDTSDSFAGNGPLSPTESKTFFRSDTNTATPPPALLRRRTDYKDEESTPVSKENMEQEEVTESQPPYPGLRRAGTGPLSAGLNPPSASPWSAGAPGSAFGSMGTFGSFAIGAGNAPTESGDKRPGFGSARGSSRFKDMLQSKTSFEDASQPGKDKALFSGLGKLPEEDGDPKQVRLRDEFKTRPGRSETNPYDEGPVRTGSAALGGSQDIGPAPASIEQMGMSAFAPHPNVGSRDFGHDEHYQQTPHGRYNAQEPMSPTNTNPFQSPHGRVEDEERDTNDSTSQASGLPPFGAARRSMYSSTDEGRHSASGLRNVSGFGGMPGFGQFGGNPMWSTAGMGSGKPALDRAIPPAFGDSVFSPLSELQSPPGGAAGGFGTFGTASRASRLGAMLPAAMQDQVRGDGRTESGLFDSRSDSGQQHAVRDPFDGTTRRHDEFIRSSGVFEDSPTMMKSAEEVGRGPFGLPGSDQTIVPTNASGPLSQIAKPGPGEVDNYQSARRSQSSGSNSENQLPAAQQRQMVMPDRMRWIYRDPQGNTQGPWSGLEMHDWFKAGFFTAELQVKKLEDTEFEPLAQLVRRIGNSREPFLVPQIGVPHGPPNPGPGNTWANPSVPPTGGPAQPPFANNFPSFGTTLTAEQQNALERRKQEEQYLMARQKEHLAQQQMAMKMQIQNGMHSLQHHSSAHSLQSQPSFGSITSPTGYQPSPIQPLTQAQPPPPAPFGHLTGPTAGPGFGRDEEIHTMVDRLSFSQRAGLSFTSAPLGPPPAEGGPSPQVSTMLQERARLQQQQQQADMRGHQDAFLGQQGRNERLEEFHTLRGQTDLPAGRLGPDETTQQPIGAPRQVSEATHLSAPFKLPVPIGHPAVVARPEPESLSLAQQVQIAAASQLESAWAKKDVPIEPPPVSISPLPAPAAQRNRLHVADALAAESRSATQTPVETPVGGSVAPWAERPVDHPKGPSLKEIQETEAKRAAEQEELAAVARRIQAEQERIAQTHVPAPAPGLPSTSTWGSAVSPVTPGTQTSSVWAKQTAVKAGTGTTAAPKKTLAQIQKEEECRKQRAAGAQAAAMAQAATNSGTNPVGKRYAELASKAAPAVPAAPGGAWTTVGTSGKAKAPAAIVATPQPVSRTVSASSTPKGRPALTTSRSTSLANPSKANEEFLRWIKGSLGKGLNPGINRKYQSRDCDL